MGLKQRQSIVARLFYMRNVFESVPRPIENLGQAPEGLWGVEARKVLEYLCGNLGANAVALLGMARENPELR